MTGKSFPFMAREKRVQVGVFCELALAVMGRISSLSFDSEQQRIYDMEGTVCLRKLCDYRRSSRYLFECGSWRGCNAQCELRVCSQGEIGLAKFAVSRDKCMRG